MSTGPTSSAAHSGEAAGVVPAVVLEDSDRLGWRGVHVERWHDDPVVPLLEAPVLENHHLILVTGGTTRIEERAPTARRQAHFVPGSIALNEAGSTRRLRWHAVSEAPIESVHVFVSPQLVDETAAAFADRPGRFPHAFELQRPEIVPHARALDWGLRHGAPALYGEAAACTLIARLLMPDPERAARGAMSPVVVARVVERMRSDLAGDVSLDELAATAHLSRFHLVRSFKAATGLPPHAYLRRLRIEHATTLLATTTLPIASVAAACGYRSASRFAAAFRAEVGAAPSRYRASIRM